MKDMDGTFVDTSDPPDTMAKYFSDVQWKVQFANLCPDGIYLIHSEIPISVDAFSHGESHLPVSNKLIRRLNNRMPASPPRFVWKSNKRGKRHHKHQESTRLTIKSTLSPL